MEQTPFGPPNCPWIKMTDTSVPENTVYLYGNLNGDKVYIGRVYDGNCIFVGTAIPKKGICIYLNKNLEVKSSSNYEILTAYRADYLLFLEMELEHRNLFVAGRGENEEILYVGRYIDSKNNTYYGWVSKTTKSVYIPMDSSEGPQVLDKGFGIMIHRFLNRLCVCPIARRS